MLEYVCKVADASGRVFQHVEAAPSEVEARQKLTDRGLYVYAVRERVGLLSRTATRRSERSVRSDDFLIFNQQFNTLLKAGLPILKALDLLAERAAAPRLRPLLREVRDRVRDGALLSEAFESLGLFSRVYTASLLAGERSGNLAGVLDSYIAYQRMTTTFRKKLRASLIYPAFLVIVATLIVSGVVTYILPRFAGLYEEMRVPLPFVTRVLVTVALEMRIPLIIGLIAVVGLGVMAFVWSRSERGGMVIDRIKLRLPFFGPGWVKFQVAQFSRTLSTLLTGGIPLVAALDTAAGATSSRLISSSIREATKSVREGQPLHASMQATGLFPELALEMIEVGEATGALAPMLASVAEFYEEDVNIRMSEALAWLEPLILVFLAIVVFFILLALYLPIFTFQAGGVNQLN
ncbi:MAG: type II secretion system F family protein [Candidatus Acidiferrales bacterium]